jgi:GNAT superfamily N-acetyltransferase
MMAIQAAGLGQVGLARLEKTDGSQLRRFFFRLSPETLYRRFHSPIVRPEQAHPERLLDVDQHDREAVVAVVEDEIVGVARYFRRPGSVTAEVAVVVADAWQRRGVATRLVTVLAELAVSAGVRQLYLAMQADNRPVLQLARRLFPDAKLTYSQGLCETLVQLGSS